jgi:gliding motility-associated-like protein
MWVFNRWGNQLFHSSNPDDGWDGTDNGKIVPTGAYYYLVKAEGTDGIVYQKKGDINVLRLKQR